MPDGKAKTQLNLPGWNDSVHIVPERFLPPDERTRRSRDRAIRIRQSPAPEIAINARQVLAAVDDIQDSFVTLSVATRLVTRFYPPADRIARVFATGADVTNVLQTANRFRLRGCARRDKYFKRLSDVPNTYRLRLSETIRTRKAGVRMTELFQVAQTTDQALGIGISLGAIMALPADAATLAVTGGDLKLNVFPYDEAYFKELLGPWQKSSTLRELPALRLQVEEAKRLVVDQRNQEINALLREPGLTGRQANRLQFLTRRGQDVSPRELAAVLGQQATITMLPAFGIPDLLDHYSSPTTTEQDLALALAGAPPPAPITPGARIIAAELAEHLRQGGATRLGRAANTTANAILVRAAKVLNAWKWILPAKDDLTPDEHLELLTALHFAWQLIGPWFSAFDYALLPHDPGRLIADAHTAADALSTWTEKIPDEPTKEVTRQLLTSLARLIYQHVDTPNIRPIAEPLPLVVAAGKLLDTGLTGNQAGRLAGATIHDLELEAIVGRDLYEELTGPDTTALLQAVNDPNPARN